MPYPVQTNRDLIIATAYELIERDGIEQLTLAQIADALHIKAPSLYRHIPNKAALIQLVNTQTFTLLFAAYNQAQHNAAPEPFQQLRALMEAHRSFAHAHPITYMLAFTTTAAEARPTAQLLEQLVQPIQAMMATLTGPEHALMAVRGALALVHGFAMLELNDQFQREGDQATAFASSVDAYLRGWQAAMIQ